MGLGDELDGRNHGLISAFSPLQKTSTGQPFWSGPKRCPKVIEFNVEVSLHLDFIEASAILFAETYGIKRKHIYA